MGIIKRYCRWYLYKHAGWSLDITENHPAKYIICLAPHTSNTDFLIGQMYMRAEGMKINFMMKKEWFFWPLGCIFKRIGGIPIHRSKHMRMTEAMADAAMKADSFKLCITPEGTRSLNTDWKKGFYYIALGAKLPILLYGLDYERKLIQCTKTIIPSGDVEKDMMEIKQYYKDFKGKKPELFSTGL